MIFSNGDTIADCEKTMAVAPTEYQIDPKLLDILRCPVAVQYTDKGDDPGKLEIVRDGHWLYSADSGYKYPVINGIPKMLAEEGAKWKDTDMDALPVPPPNETIYSVAEEALSPEMETLAKTLSETASTSRQDAVKQLKDTAQSIRQQAQEADPDGAINQRADSIASGLEEAADVVATGRTKQAAPVAQAASTPIGILVFMFVIGLIIGLLMRRKPKKA